MYVQLLIGQLSGFRSYEWHCPKLLKTVLASTIGACQIIDDAALASFKFVPEQKLYIG